MLGFSEYTVNKWECGASMPGIECLFRTADLLHVNLIHRYTTREAAQVQAESGIVTVTLPEKCSYAILRFTK